MVRKHFMKHWIRALLAVFALPPYCPMCQANAVQQNAPSVPVTGSIPPDYLPMGLGNRWIYARAETRFKRTDTVRVEIIGTPIIKWKTYYIFSQMPFVPGLESANNIPVRYDSESRSLLRLTKEGEVPLLPVGVENDAKFESSVDEKGQPVANRLSYLTCADCPDSGMEIVFDRGIGVTAVQVNHPWGVESFKLRSAEVNHQKFGEPIPVEKPKDGSSKPLGPIVSRADPNLTLTVEKKDVGVRLLFKVKNPTESFLSFNFNSSQTYDFVVREKDSGSEIWRWSKGNFFSHVVRNLALLPEQEWQFEAFWDFKDSERNDVRTGAYLASAILTTREPRETEPIPFSIP